MVPGVVCSDGMKILAMRVTSNEVGGGGVESGKWVTGNDKGCGARRALDPSVFPVNEPQMGRSEVKFIIALGCLQDAGIELHFPIAGFLCVGGELVWSVWINC